MVAGTLSPFVYWAQTESNVFLKVDLKDAKSPNVDFEARKITFKAEGTGAKGKDTYAFALNFHSDIDLETTSYKVLDSKVDFNIAKAEKAWWPRLTSMPQKPAWLKVDFDRWQSEDDINDEVRDVREDYPGHYERLQREELGYRKEDLRKVYLIFYNLLMYIGFLYVCLVISALYLKHGADCYPNVYISVRQVIVCVQLLQLLEVLHCIFGYTSGSPLVTFGQAAGRCMILIGFIEYEPRVQTKPVVFYLFITWSLIEIVRYPYYLSVLMKRQNYMLTWLRYSLWIILYPMGFVIEGVVVFMNIPYVDETKRFTWVLPNRWNFTFNMSLIMRLYLLVFIFPLMYFFMSVMNKQRNKKLGKRTWLKQN